jgi:hypothetical protein
LIPILTHLGFRRTVPLNKSAEYQIFNSRITVPFK